MPNSTHICYLDSIRGLAALTVITEHYVIGYGLPCQHPLCQQILDSSPFNIWWDGSAAVSMFFVLSGLVLSLKYFRSGSTPQLNDFDLFGFSIARLFRIWLPYLVILSLSAALYLQTRNTPIPQTLMAPSPWLTGLWGDHQLSILEILRESLLLNLPATIVLLPQAWTLSIELQMSLLLPIGLLLIKRSSSWFIFFALFAVSLLPITIFLLHFALGLLIARYHSPISYYLARNRWTRRSSLILGLSFYSCSSLLTGLNLHENLIWLSSGLGSSCILIFALSSLTAQKILSNPLLRQLGKVSYSAYLIHMLILLFITPYLLQALELITDNVFILWLSAYLVTVLIVQLLSIASYHLLEIPSISAGKQIRENMQEYLPVL